MLSKVEIAKKESDKDMYVVITYEVIIKKIERPSKTNATHR